MACACICHFFVVSLQPICVRSCEYAHMCGHNLAVMRLGKQVINIKNIRI